VTLARAPLAVAGVPERERGWLERDELCRMLATDELRLNVEVCRARKQFAALGIQGRRASWIGGWGRGGSGSDVRRVERDAATGDGG